MAFTRGSALTFAPSPRLMCAHEGTVVPYARLAAAVRYHLPARARGTKDHAVFDLVVTGGNPVLAAIAVSVAVGSGLKVAVGLPYGDDDSWPYDLLGTEQGARLLRAVTGFGGTPSTCTSRILERLPAGAVTVLPAAPSAFSDRTPPDEIGLYPIVEQTSKPSGSAERLSVCSAFASAARRFTSLYVGPRRGTILFARRMLLTARTDAPISSSSTAADRIRWSHPLVGGVGSAGADPVDGEGRASAMIGDLLSVSRGVEYAGDV